MKKVLKVWLALVVLNWTGTMWAQRISQQEALDRVVKYMSQQRVGRRAPARSSELVATPVKANSIYAFNRQGGGYVIASADSRALPILGYSDTGSIDWAQMPENMRAWLMQYDEAMATLGDRTDLVDGNWVNGTSKRVVRQAVEPLIKTHWYQTEPYWDQCPLYYWNDTTQWGERCVTGCVATAMAQIMNYYRWPNEVTQGIPGYDVVDYETGDTTTHTEMLPPVTFDWDHMLDTYRVTNPETGDIEILGTEEERNAVATLMRYCGQAVEMEYGPTGSGAYSFLVPEALQRYFGYPAATYLERAGINSIDAWENLVYGELAQGRPVYYAGSTLIEGHAFLCDGYDGNGLFHFNWGWNGKSDGYYTLSVLNPREKTDESEGYANTGYGPYQLIIVYIDPSMETAPEIDFPYLDFYQNEKIEVNDEDVVTFYFEFFFPYPEYFTMEKALGTIAEDGTLNPCMMAEPNDTLANSYNTTSINVPTADIASGDSLVLYPMLYLHDIYDKWCVLPPLSSHVVIGRTEDGEIYRHVYGNPPAKTIDFLGIRFGTPTGQVEENADLTLSMRNNMELDYQFGVYFKPVYYGSMNPEEIDDDTTPIEEGDYTIAGAYLRGGETTDILISFTPTQSGWMKMIVEDVKAETVCSAMWYVENPTGLTKTTIQDNGAVYDLMGRRLNGIPHRKGLYIEGNRLRVK